MFITYRKAVKEDAMLLIDIYNSAFYADFCKFGECPGYGKSKEAMERAIVNYPKYIIYADYIAVGAISWKEKDTGKYEIGSLCIIPEYQRKGIGTKAFYDLLEQFEDWKEISLVTPSSNQGNVSFCIEKCGFYIEDEILDGKVSLYRFIKKREYDEKWC